ncbi:MAG: class I SAM-dependent methyltransferase [Eubacterium sp.]|nr:class I SAM-dependent methyltransferase [Eubacterium sp.]
MKKKWITKKRQVFFFHKAHRILLDPTENLEELFQKMEEGVKKAEDIYIKNPGKKRSVEQCVNAFIEKYKVLISCVERSYEGECITHIRLKAREQDASGHYADIQGEYDEEYYLQDCGGFAEFQKFHGKRLDARLANMMYLVEPQDGDCILDIGCGRGELTYMLSRYASKTVGIDYSKAAVAIAKKNFGKYQDRQNLRYECGDIMQLDQKEKYNKIVMADVYEHIEAEVMEKLLQKIALLLTENGVLYIHTAPNLDYYEKVYARQVQAVNSGGGISARESEKPL